MQRKALPLQGKSLEQDRRLQWSEAQQKSNSVTALAVLLLKLSNLALGWQIHFKCPNRGFSNTVVSSLSPAPRGRNGAPLSNMGNYGSPLMSSLDPIADEVVRFDESFVSTFLNTYWQKKPLMIRRAVHEVGPNAVITGDDLLNLMMEEDVCSRMLYRHPDRDPATGDDVWIQESGPFDASDLDTIPQKDWTLLVQEVDRHVPAVADLWERYFNFVPLWRRDDIMVSYSRKGGGIGAHVDGYDVFLIQGAGTRRWSIENRFVSYEEEQQRAVHSDDRCMLGGFRRDQSWELQPGDMLYLPARLPHEGIALDDDCMTLSIGFRAATKQSIVAAYCAHVCQDLTEHDLFSDSTLDAHEAAVSPGSLQAEAAESMRDALHKCLVTGLAGGTDGDGGKGADDTRFDRWVGEFLSVPMQMRISGPTPFFLANLRGENDDAPPVTSPIEPSFLRCHEDDEGRQYFYERDNHELEVPICVCHEQHSVASPRVFRDAASVVIEVLRGTCLLRLMEGTRVAYTDQHICFDGRCLPLPAPQESYGSAGTLLCDSRIITPEQLRRVSGWSEGSAKLPSTGLMQLLVRLVCEGYYYPVDL